MKNIIQIIEETVNAIKSSELRKNPKASAKALEIKRMISDLKGYVQNPKPVNQGVLNIDHKTLLEN